MTASRKRKDKPALAIVVKRTKKNKNMCAFYISTDLVWYKRLWNLIANPFRYIFKGEIKL